MSVLSRARESNRDHDRRVAVAAAILRHLTPEQVAALASLTQPQLEAIATIVERANEKTPIVLLAFALWARAFVEGAVRLVSPKPSVADAVDEVAERLGLSEAEREILRARVKP